MGIKVRKSGWLKVGAIAGLALLGAVALQQACAVKDCPDEAVGTSQCVENEIETCGDGNKLSYDSCASDCIDNNSAACYCVEISGNARCVTKKIWESQVASASASVSASSSHASSSGHGGAGGAGGQGGQGEGGQGGMGGGMTFPPVNGCTFDMATDITKQPIIHYGDNGFSYTPKCTRVKAGTSVTWTSMTASFSTHPLQGGTVGNMSLMPDANSPIKFIASGTSVTYAFNQPGEYGFYCVAHALTNGMTGAIFVTAQ